MILFTIVLTTTLIKLDDSNISLAEHKKDYCTWALNEEVWKKTKSRKKKTKK